MIRSFQHKGLEAFLLSGSKAGFAPTVPSACNCSWARWTRPRSRKTWPPGWKLHPLKGDLAGHWAVTVNGNWRLTFRFIGSDAALVDYQDYH